MLVRTAALRSLSSAMRGATAKRSITVAVGNDINSKNLEIQRIKTPKTKLPKEQLTFGTTFTDHMLEIDWEQGKGWQNPVIRPYGPIAMDPASSALHYALQCFEGMKAYVGPKGEIRLFRPDMNMKRLNSSMKRLLLPQFDNDELTNCLKELIKLDKDWVPEGDGYSLYIRPTGISTHPYIGVGASLKAKIFIILSPVGPYYPEGFNPVKLFANDTYVRAWPGGTGGFKLGANYAPGIMPQAAAGQKGYSQNLWIFGPDHDVTEVGTMNLFIHWINEQGEKELITPPLTRGDILPGITRDSILTLAREWGEFKVTEGNVNMKQVQKAVHEDRVLEIFGSGTAAVVSPVSTINYLGEDLNIPLDGKDGKAGKLAERVWKELSDIQYGRVEHPWSVIVD
ncbi:Branched-chain amino acid aminotransferase, partial [Globisporangium splendens]